MSGRATQLKYAKAGKCQRCGRRKPASATLCSTCLGSHNETTADLKARLLSEGRCVWCGQPNLSACRACDDCREAYNARRRKTA